MEREYIPERPRYSERERRYLVRKFLVSELIFLYVHEERLTPEAKMFIRKAIRHLANKDAWDREVRGEKQDPTVREMIVQSRILEPGGADSSGGTGKRVPKKIGPFLVVEVEAGEDMKIQDGEFAIRKGETYLEIHAPIVDAEDIALGKIRNALGGVTEYIQAKGLTPKYVLGVAVTNDGKRIGRVAQRMGFEVSSLSLPSEVHNQLKQLNNRIEREGIFGESIGSPSLIYQATESFVRNFPPQPSGKGAP